MFKKLQLMLVLVFLITFTIACGENGGNSFSGSNVPENGGNIGGGNNDNGGGDTGGGDTGGGGGNSNDNGTDNGGNNGGTGGDDLGNSTAPDDQTPDAVVNKDFTNPINMVGRYKINEIKVMGLTKSPIVNETAESGNFRGAFTVQPNVVGANVSVDMGLKFQFHPNITDTKNISDSLAYVNTKLVKVIDTTGGLNFAKIFADLGAVVDGDLVHFTLKSPDVPVAEGQYIVITLEKLSNTPNLTLVNDPRKYWLKKDEVEPEIPDVPVEPENPGEGDGNGDGDGEPTPEPPVVEGLIPIDMNNLSTLTGHYTIFKFSTYAGGITVDSSNTATVTEMQGEVEITGLNTSVNVTSKMQMKSPLSVLEPEDKYNFTVYEPFKPIDGGALQSTTNNPYKYSSAKITKLADNKIQIVQNLQKDMFGSPVDVEVAVIAIKVSNTKNGIANCGYWTDAIVKMCGETGEGGDTGGGDTGGGDTGGGDTGGGDTGGGDTGGGDTGGGIGGGGEEGGDGDLGESTVPDDQTPDAEVDKDFTNPIKMVGRYKISEIQVIDVTGAKTINEKAQDGNFRGAFGVQPIVGKDTVRIDMGVKFQFHPNIISSKNIPEALEFVNTKFERTVELGVTLDFNKIFADLGAVVDGDLVHFTLKSPDVPVAEGEYIVITLEKLSGTPNLALVNDPRKYWLKNGETEPEIPENPDEGDGDTDPEPPAEEGLIAIDMNNYLTLTGQYEITSFITEAGGTVVDSKDLPKMQGEISIVGSAAQIDAVSKMQMVADVFGMTDSDKYNYTVYNPFRPNASNVLESTTNNPYVYSSATVKKLADNKIQINQRLKKNAPVIGITDVVVTLVAVKVSNENKAIADCGYWTDAAIMACNPDGTPAMTNIDVSNPATLIGSYALVNYGMEYQRPAGGQYEKVWAKVQILGGLIYEGELLIDKIQGEAAINNNGGGNFIDFKVQLNSAYQVQKEYLWGDFNDIRWRYFRETDKTDYKLTPTANKNEIGVEITRTFSYRYWGVQHNVSTKIIMILKKVSDTPNEITNDKYWQTSEPAIVIPTFSDPRTFSGHYKLTNIGHAYNRPNSVGSTYEDNWATNPTVMTGLRGELSIKNNGSDLKLSQFHGKYQVNSTYYVLYDDKALVRTNFSDPRWKFFSESFSNPYYVGLEGNNVKVCVKRNFEYRFWKVEWLAWNNHWETTNPSVNLCFVAEKISDTPQDINGNRYW